MSKRAPSMKKHGLKVLDKKDLEVHKLIPYEKNAKLHPPEEVERLANSIEEFGFQGRIEVDKNLVVINGHGRLKAIKKLIEEGRIEGSTIPVAILEGSDEQIKAYRLADNAVAGNNYDTNLLSAELEEIHIDMDFDMSGIFSEKDLEFATEDLGEMDLDALTGDISDQVAEQSGATQAAIDAESGQEVSLTKILGYSKVPGNMQRAIARLQAHAERQTGMSGAEALGQFAVDFVGLNS